MIVDCDVIQADGGTRTAAISGAWVALRIAVDKLLADKAIAADPIRTQVAAVSCGIHNGAAVLDLDYVEDSTAGSDGNFVLTADGAIVEAQFTAEGETFDEEGLLRLLRLARIGCTEIFEAQLKAAGAMRRIGEKLVIATHNAGQVPRDFRAARAVRHRVRRAPRRWTCPRPRKPASASSTMPRSRPARRPI